MDARDENYITYIDRLCLWWVSRQARKEIEETNGYEKYRKLFDVPPILPSDPAERETGRDHDSD